MSANQDTKLRCLVVDDEMLAIEGISNHISKLDFLTLDRCCQSAIEAAEILKRQQADLMFLDINMPMLSGLDFLESLENPPLTILTTAYSEYALDGYRLGVVDYLLKPIGFQRFFQAATKARTAFESRLSPAKEGSTDAMYCRQGNTFRRIETDRILFAEGMQNYVRLHLEDEKIVIHQTMSSLEEILPSSVFFRIHRSWLVNVNRITSVSGNRLFIGDTELPVSSQRMEEFMNSVVLKKLISK